MLRNILASLALAVTGFSVQGQEAPQMKFGAVSKEELEMTSYKADTSASAIYLFEYGEFRLNKSTYHSRIKILKASGLEHSDILAYVNKDESFRNLKASSYEIVNGQIVETKLTKESLFRDDYNESTDILRFPIPKVKVGSVIEFTFDVANINKDKYNEYSTGRDWHFQHWIPVAYSEFIFECPVGTTYHKIVQGYHPVAKFEEKGRTWRWVMKDIPAFNQEDFAPADENFFAKVRTSLADLNTPTTSLFLNTTWERIGSLYLTDNFFDDQVIGTRFLKADVERITAGKTTQLEKVAAIDRYLKSTVEWNGKETVNGKVAKFNVENRKLSSGQVNLLYLSMLRFAGIEVYPLLISTRDNGYVRREFPDLYQFNRTIVRAIVDGKPMNLDATNPDLPLDYLPVECLNGEGLVILKPDHVEWLEVENNTKQKSKSSVNAEFVINNSGDISGQLVFTKTGYEAAQSRKEYRKKGAELYKKDVSSQFNLTVNDAKYTGMENPLEPVKETYSISIPDFVSVGSDLIYIEPTLFNDLDGRAFRSDNRVYPLDFGYSKELVWQLKFKLPEGYKVDETPAPRTAVVPDNGGRFMYSIVPGNGEITVISQYVLGRSLYGHDEYSNLREFHRTAVSKLDEKIVLKKN